MASAVIITIDGPAGSGKSTVARQLAKDLGFYHLNTGQIFRALTAACLRKGLFQQEREKIEDFVKDCEICRLSCGESVKWSIDQCDVTSRLIDADVSHYVSQLAAVEGVRGRAKHWQRKWVRGKNTVVEGRDAGSAVFTSADVKIYLTAELSVRAARRWEQVRATKESDGIALAEIESDLARRDRLDETRSIDPLKVPAGAIYLDTTQMSAQAATDYLSQFIRKRL